MQFFRYIFVGGASFLADYVLLHLITEAGVHYLISGTISFLVGLTEGLMWLFTEKLNWYYMISKAVAAIIVLFWNFFAKKLLLYRK